MTLHEKILHLRRSRVYPFFMFTPARATGRGLFVVAAAIALAAGCATAPARRTAAAAPPPAAAPSVETIAIEEFGLGREAALSGDFECARYHFARVLDVLRPAAAPPPFGKLRDFSAELYDGIQRYEALAG